MPIMILKKPIGKQYKSIRIKYSDVRSDVYVCEEGGVVLGFGAFVRDANMVRIFVMPGYQRKGIGSALLKFFEEHYDSFNCRCYRQCKAAVNFLQNRKYQRICPINYQRIEKRLNIDSGKEEYVFEKGAAE